MIFWLTYAILKLFAGFAIFLLILEFFLRSTKNYKNAHKVPGSTIYPIFGSVWEILSSDPEKSFYYLRRQAIRFKTSWRHYILGRLVINIIRAKDAEIILSSSKHTGKSLIYYFLRSFLGSGLLTSNGKKWQHRRKILTPAFHFNILKQFHQTIRNETDVVTDTIGHDNNPKGINVNTLMSRFTLNTICETAMGVKISTFQEPDEYRRNIHEIGKTFVHRMSRPWLFVDAIYKITLKEYTFKKLVAPVHQFTRDVVEKRRQAFKEKTDRMDLEPDENIYETKKTRYALLDTLFDAETRGEIDNEGIREEVDTFMFEGHDTTACGLILTLLLLAHHPEVQELMYDEIIETIEKNNNEELQLTQYNSMRYFERVLKESMRIYPPVPFISRAINEELEIDGVVFESNTVFHIHIFDIHRDPYYYPDPEKFDPDRFLPENVEKRHPYAYIPFSAGPRNCIGQKYALMEMKVLLTQIIRKYKIMPVTRREDVEFIADLVLRTKNPVRVLFKLRK